MSPYEAMVVAAVRLAETWVIYREAWADFWHAVDVYGASKVES